MQNFYNYSVAMERELDALDEKVQLLLQLCERLRRDNGALRQQLATARSENDRLNQKISTAATRLETLITQVPEDNP